MHRQLTQLWIASSFVYPKRSLSALLQRARVFLLAWRHADSLSPLLNSDRSDLIKRTIGQRPQLLGLIVAPYLSKNWGPRERLGALARHIAALERFPGLLDFAPDQQVSLAPLPHLGRGYCVVVDKAIWFHREGSVVLNIFRDDTRLFSIAFALDMEGDDLVAIVGGIQGRHLPDIKDEYHDMTKASFMTRPRDLLVEIFKAFCRAIDVRRIYAISDEHRHHRSPFFGNKNLKLLQSMNYDEVWLDRGATRSGEFYDLPVARTDRREDEIPARKRSMYRKRYAMLDEIEGNIADGMKHAVPGPIDRAR
jgi:uncharacterized protein VirK/YbjX